jgi:Kef-type K+ transport system membrane component KefB
MSGDLTLYTEPGAVDVLIISSFLYLLNIFRVLFDKLINAGLIGEVLVGIIYGSPLAAILDTTWESTFRFIGYLGLILIVFEGELNTLPGILG